MGANQRFIDRGEGDLCTSSPAGPSLTGHGSRVDIHEAGGRGSLGGWSKEANRSWLNNAANRNIKGETVRDLCRGKKLVLAKLDREADAGKRVLHDDPQGKGIFLIHIAENTSKRRCKEAIPLTRLVDTGASNA